MAVPPPPASPGLRMEPRSGAPARARPLRLLALAFGPVIVLALLTELALGALGLGHPSGPRGRGFDREERYLVPDPERPGHARTQMFDGGPEDEVVVPPRTGARRVFLFGGSNAARTPATIVQQALNAELAASGERFEVFNFGRSGYGSARVAILLEQALELEPDLVVLYSGHNEFVEYGFQLDVAERAPSSLARAVPWAESLRTYHALAAAFRPRSERGTRLGPTPQRSAFEHDKFREFSYAQTLAHFERYRANLRAMCALAEERGARVLMCTLFGNQLAPPFVWSPAPELPLDVRARCRAALLACIEHIPARLRLVQAGGVAIHPQPPDWRRGTLGRSEPVPRLRALAGEFGALGACWPTPATWSATAWAWTRALEPLHAGALEAGEREALAAAADEARAVLELQPDHPLAHWLLGQCLEGLGERDAAAEHWALAARYDRAPLKASDLTNEIVRSVAAEFSSVQLFDLEQWVRAQCPHGVVGWELMEDHCHPHERAQLALGREFGLAIARAWQKAEQR